MDEVQFTSPNGNARAIVDWDERCVHFYVQGAPKSGLGINTCWVRNLREAPDVINVSEMKDGIPPMLPAEFCAHPRGAPAPNRSALSVVWLEEGDGAALFEGTSLLAVIPGWSGQSGFHGYARDCIKESELCWPLGTPTSNAMFERVKAAKEFWDSWDGDPWPAYQGAQLERIERAIGKEINYYAIDGRKWPPKALLKIPIETGFVFLTIGVSLQPQPRAEMISPQPARRIELAMAMESELGADAQTVGGYISGQASLPWKQFTWLGHGHTIPCDSIPTGKSGTKFTAVLLSKAPQLAPKIEMPDFRGERVEVLWMVPITECELKYAVSNGSANLLKRFPSGSPHWIHGDRMPVVS